MYSQRDIVVIGAVLASVPLCFIRPFFGVVIWTIIAFLNPHQLSWGAARTFPVAMVVAVPTLAGAVLFDRAIGGLRRDLTPIFVLWAWFTLTTINAMHTPAFAFHAADTVFRYLFVSKILLMTVLTVALVYDWRRFRWLLMAIAISFGFYIAKALPWLILTGGQYRLRGPEGTMLGDNNDFGLALNMTLPLFFFLARTEGNRKLKWLFWALFVLTVPAIFATYSRGAMVGAVAVLSLMLMRVRQKILLAPVVVLAGILAVVLAPEKWQRRMDFTKEGAVLDASAMSRINSWTYSYNLAKDYPFMGGGFEAFTPTLFAQYAPNPADVHGPHSIYFGVMAEHGFTGLFLYLSVVGYILWTLMKMARKARRRGDTKVEMYASMCQFSIAGFLASGAFLGRAYFDYYFTLVACAIVVKRLAVQDWRAIDEEEEVMDTLEKVAS